MSGPRTRNYDATDLRALIARWREEYRVALEHDKRRGLRDTTVELGGKAIAADELEATLAASSSPPPPKVSASGSQGEVSSRQAGLAPLPDAGSMRAASSPLPLEDGPFPLSDPSLSWDEAIAREKTRPAPEEG